MCWSRNTSIQRKLLVLVEGFAKHFWLVNQKLLLGGVFLELLLRFRTFPSWISSRMIWGRRVKCKVMGDRHCIKFGAALQLEDRFAEIPQIASETIKGIHLVLVVC
jgi:hypothetical protein